MALPHLNGVDQKKSKFILVNQFFTLSLIQDKLVDQLLIAYIKLTLTVKQN